MITANGFMMFTKNILIVYFAHDACNSAEISETHKSKKNKENIPFYININDVFNNNNVYYDIIFDC